MNNKLNVIQEIEKLGLETFIDRYNLKSKDYGHKFNLKYDQLNTKKTPATNECRGIVISKDMKVLSMPFVRFSNYEENSRKLIDWDSATYWEKTDGTMIQFYYDPIADKWCVGTTGTAEAVDMVSCRDKIKQEVYNYDFNLTDLFHTTCEKLNIDLSKCQKGCTYIFELATEYNKVINSYSTDTVVLLGIRDLTMFNEYSQETLDYFAQDINCGRPKQYFFKSEKEMLDSLKNVKYGDTNFEGYVVVDMDFNRVKVKSNTYIIYAQFNGNVESKWRLVDVVLANEIDEVSASFPTLREQMEKMKQNFDNIIEPVKEKFEDLKERFDSLERKDFFIEGNKAVNFDKSKKALLSIFTQLFNDKNISFDDALTCVNRKALYKMIK